MFPRIGPRSLSTDMRIDKIALIFAFAALSAAAGVDAASADEPVSYGLMVPSFREPGGGRPVVGQSDGVVLPANPLWAVRLDALSATRDRPIFSPSRRPPAPPQMLLAPPPPPPKPVAAPREPDRPPLALLGTIVSPSHQIAIFREEATSETTRLKAGDDYKGWSLRSIMAGKVEFEGPRRGAVLELPQPQTASTPEAAPTSDAEPPARHRKR
ncbi:MAG TPA: hypothetical protein VFL62_07165 [Bradyrhizobium sp.]|uniref:hypothetical protein n=1 Tax=Bradyrhizobium sp. TaxID=376 RepID=UPI002D7F0779|nr:hypothetical protein [Bradyrhizobium sp.]HET7885987.1 hypothetical protein [Bradyrhizobium sp.]